LRLSGLGCLREWAEPRVATTPLGTPDGDEEGGTGIGASEIVWIVDVEGT